MLVKCIDYEGNGYTARVTRVGNRICAQVFGGHYVNMSAKVSDSDNVHRLAVWVWEYVMDAPAILPYFGPFLKEIQQIGDS